MSINIEHKDISVGEIHSPFQWEVLNVAELSTIVPEGVNDVRKVAFVVDDGTGNPTAYVLTQFTPAIEWKPLVNVVGGVGSVIWGGIGGTVANQTDLVAYLQANFYTQAQINSFMNGYYTTSEIDVIASGKADLVGGLVPASQLPSYVDDVLEYANLAALPITGEAGKIYITLDTNRQYRWGGSSYIDITGFVDNVNGKTGAVVVTKEDVGLTNVDNTSDVNKPISIATQTALDGKADLVGGLVPASQLPSYVDDVLEYANLAALPITGEAGKIYITLDTNRQYRWGGSSYIDITGFVDNVNGKTGAVVVTKEDVGLTNVDNTSDVNKPISIATQTALDGKAPTVHEHDSRYYTKSQTNTALVGFKNYIINGAFNVNQYERGTQVNFSLGYPYIDRFWVISSSSVTMNGALSNPVGFTNHLSVTKTAGADTMIFQRYELPVKDKAKSSLNGRTFTFSCWVMSSTANMIESIYILKQGSTAGAYEERGNGQPGTASIAHAANVWTRIWFTMTFDWLSEAGDYLEIRIDPANTLAGTIHTTGWQLEEGSVATPFEHRPYGLELALCQRYYEAGTIYGFGFSTLTSRVRAALNTLKVTKRVAPSVTITNQTYSYCSSLETDVATSDMVGFSVISTANLPFWVSGNFTASAEL